MLVFKCRSVTRYDTAQKGGGGARRRRLVKRARASTQVDFRVSTHGRSEGTSRTEWEYCAKVGLNSKAKIQWIIGSVDQWIISLNILSESKDCLKFKSKDSMDHWINRSFL